mgnify:CR=1 FL=1
MYRRIRRGRRGAWPFAWSFAWLEWLPVDDGLDGMMIESRMSTIQLAARPFSRATSIGSYPVLQMLATQLNDEPIERADRAESVVSWFRETPPVSPSKMASTQASDAVPVKACRLTDRESRAARASAAVASSPATSSTAW